MSQIQEAHYSLLTTGDDAFAQSLQAIASARHSLRFEMYIFDASPIGQRVRTALSEAAQRGVRVQVLIDSVGSMTLLDGFWEPLRRAGGEMRWFNPVSLRRFGFRNHRKLIVSDERVAIIGGFNVAAAYEGDGITRGWRDLGMEVTGPLVRELALSFDEMFARAEFRHKRFTRWRRRNNKHPVIHDTGELLLSGPGRGRSAIKSALRNDLARARHVQIIVAYFLPPLRLRRAGAQPLRPTPPRRGRDI
jgi:cardiolipin synthase A/B